MNNNFRNSIKRLACLSLALIICFTGIFAMSADSVEAKAAPKLSAKSVLLAQGGSQKITLKNGNGKWSIKGNGVVKIKKKTKKYIIVSPVKSGTATIVCKTGKKTLKCTVKVLNDRIGKLEEEFGYGAVVGQKFGFEYTLPEGVSLDGTEYDHTIGKVTTKTELDSETGETKVSMTVKALSPGRFGLKINYINNGEPEYEYVTYAFINGFRGKAKAKKTAANYRKWRKQTLTSLASSDMSSWEIIDAIGSLISSGKYGLKGGATGMQLWYGGNGTCVSGAMMMDDFMKDLGINCKVHFAGKDGGAVDIYGYSIMYMSQHKNVRVKLGGKKYELNPQPGMTWPIGTVKR